MEQPVSPCVCVRQALPDDLCALAALRAAAGWGSGGLDGSFAAVAAGRQSILLAEWDGRLVGTVTANFATSGTGRARGGHISDLVVAPLWRRRGIGSELLEAAEAAVRQRGIPFVTLDVDAQNAEAIRLYLGRGYGRIGPAQFPWGPGHTMRKVLDVRADRSAAPPNHGWAAWPQRLWRLLARQGRPVAR